MIMVVMIMMMVKVLMIAGLEDLGLQGFGLIQCWACKMVNRVRGIDLGCFRFVWIQTLVHLVVSDSVWIQTLVHCGPQSI